MDSDRSAGPKLALTLAVEAASVSCEHNAQFPLKHDDFNWPGAHVKASSY